MICINKGDFADSKSFVNAVMAAFIGAKETPTIREIGLFRPRNKGGVRLIKMGHENPFRPASDKELRGMLQTKSSICRVEIKNVPHSFF